MLIEEFEQLGFSKFEAQIYLHLVEHGKTTASILSRMAQINRTTTYEVLNRMLAKGFVSYILESGVKKYIASRPETISKYFQERSEQAAALSLKLKSLQKTEEEIVEVYEGKKGIKTILWDVLNYKEYVAFGSSGKFLEIMGHDFVAFQNQKRKLGIKSRILQTSLSRELKNVAFANFRIISDEYSSPITTIVYGNKVVIIIWGIIPHAVVISSKQVYEQFMRQFGLLWKLGKKPTN